MIRISIITVDIKTRFSPKTWRFRKPQANEATQVLRSSLMTAV